MPLTDHRPGVRAPGSSRETLGGVLWLTIPLVWFELWHRLTQNPWDDGRSRVFWMTLVLAFFFLSGSVGRRLPVPGGRVVPVLLVAVWLLLAWAYVRTAVDQLERADLSSQGSDMATNTVAAEDWFLKLKNPYAHRAQTQHQMEPGPHLTVDERGVRMFGVPYSYGYPYFPMMFLSYLPLRLVAGGVHGIRLANLLLIFVNALLVLLIARELAPRGRRFLIGALGCVACLAVPALLSEFFRVVVVDFVISTFALAAFLFLCRRRMWMAGVFFGLAQACKLLPGPLFVAPALIWLFRRPGFWPLLGGYFMASVAIMGPFVAWSPAQFLSSTILLYLTHHASGDKTSLLASLPPGAKVPFLALGVVLISGCLLLARRSSRRDDVVWPMSLAFAAYFIFLAFAQMIHLNYFWSVYPLACVTWAVRYAGRVELQSAVEAGQGDALAQAAG